MKHTLPTLVTLGLALLAALHAAEPEPAVIRVGMIGLDTSHAVIFTRTLNQPDHTGDLAGIKVVAAYPGGNPDFPLSRDRLW
jgi:hypothetical protein